MKLYRYWACSERAIKDIKGNAMLLKKWGGSNDSTEDAAEAARRAVNALAERLLNNPDLLRWPMKKTIRDEYVYGVRDLPEEVIEMLGDDNGITRNRYGCLVLNTRALLFIDIDFPPLTFGQRIGKLFGKTPPDPKDAALNRLKEWLPRHPGTGVRIYSTAAGLRYLFTDAPYAVDASALEWMDELGGDALYRRLCHSQQCYRARLTPKPWRVEMNAPPNQYPRDDSQIGAFQRWLSEYESSSRGYATCALLEHWGERNINPDLAPLVAKHDELCRAESRMPLA